MNSSEQKLAAVMIVELTESGHSIQQTGDVVEEVILHYRSLRDKPPGLVLRVRRLATRLLLPFGR